MSCEQSETLSYQISVSSPGKFILVGEHAVVHGARALAFPLKERRLSLKATSGKGGISLGTCFERGNAIKTPSFDMEAFFREACALLNVSVRSLCFDISSEIPIGSGLGSSASLCVSLVKIIEKLYGLTLGFSQIAQVANKLESTFHGNPSGLDTAVIASEKPIFFKKKESPVEVSLGKEAWPFVLIDTGERMPTYLMVEKTSGKFRGSEGHERLQRFDELAFLAGDSLAQSDFLQMKKVFNKADKLLKEIGVVTERAYKVSEEILKIGVLGVKITGSGGGGCLLALLDPEKSLQQLEKLQLLFGQQRVFLAKS